MRIYLASRYDRRMEMLGYAAILEAEGHVVTSRWVRGDHEGATDPETLARCAREDLDDIAGSDLFVTFTETPAVGFTSGGRHVELGYAMGLWIAVVIVGPPENVFHHLRLGIINRAPDCGGLMDMLTEGRLP